MKNGYWLLFVLLIVVSGGLGFFIGKSQCAVTAAIRKAQNLGSSQEIDKKKQAIELLTQTREYIDLALEKVKVEEARKMIALSLGEALIRHEMWLEAIPYLEEAKEILPGDFLINYDLGVAYTALYNLEQLTPKKDEYYHKAYDHLTRALTVKPNNSDANYSLGILLYHRGQSQQALSHFLTVLDQFPNDVPALLAVARIYYDNGDLQKAQKIYLKLENLLPQNHPKLPTVLHNLKLIERSIGNE